MATHATLTITCDHPGCFVTCSAGITDLEASLWATASTTARRRGWSVVYGGPNYCDIHAPAQRRWVAQVTDAIETMP